MMKASLNIVKDMVKANAGSQSTQLRLQSPSDPETGIQSTSAAHSNAAGPAPHPTPHPAPSIHTWNSLLFGCMVHRALTGFFTSDLIKSIARRIFHATLKQTPTHKRWNVWTLWWAVRMLMSQ